MDVYGQLSANDGKTEYPHIPDWYQWQRACVREELEKGEYALATEELYKMKKQQRRARRAPAENR